MRLTSVFAIICILIICCYGQDTTTTTTTTGSSQSSSAEELKPCVYKHGDNTYDLNQLTKDPMYFTEPEIGNFSITVCGFVPGDAQVNCGTESSICFEDVNTAKTSKLGSWEQITDIDNVNGSTFSVKYGGGSVCGTMSFTYSDLYFYCQEGTDGTIKSVSRGPLNTKAGCYQKFSFTIGAQYFCPPKKGGLSGGDVFLIIFFCGFGAYFIFGTAIQCYRGRRGSEAIPNKHFWGSFFGLVGAGAGFIKAKVTGSSNHGYQSV